MVPQLLLVKRLCLASGEYAAQADPVAAGMAISLLQDAVELYVWTLIKERDVPVKDQSGFVANLDTLQRAGLTMPFTAKLLELNRARVGFKHYGNLPAPSEAEKHRIYAEDALRQAMLDHFRVNFDDLSLMDLVADAPIRDLLRDAETKINAGALHDSAVSLAQARSLVFGLTQKYLPSVNTRLSDMDCVLNQIDGVRGVNSFAYLTEYLGMLREASLAAMFRMPVEDFAFLRSALPSAYQTGDGKWYFTQTRSQYTEAECRRAITAIVGLCLKLQARA
ncbi:MAG: hypothetical protein ACYCUI_13615 [Vulcanimicrobiaceae bacterium]